MGIYNVIICLPVKWDQPVVPGSIQVTCHRCGEPVWLSPSGIAIVGEYNCYSLCVDCGIIMMLENPGEIMGPTEAQLRELEEWRRRS